METQKDQILDYLKFGNSITPIEALDKFGCFRLSAVVFKLRKCGYRITSELEQTGRKRYARYRLIQS